MVFREELTYPSETSSLLKLKRLISNKIAIITKISPKILEIINNLKLSNLDIYILCNTIRFIYFEENYEEKTNVIAIMGAKFTRILKTYENIMLENFFL